MDPPTEVLPRLGAEPPAAGSADGAAGARAQRSPLRRRALLRRVRAQGPLLAVLAVVVLAFVRIAEQHWREGTTELGLALLLGAVLRALCPEHVVGLLAVRERRADVVLYAAFGLVVLFVSLTITGGPLTAR